ncbi:MAG: hypothetical protein IJ188_06345 [Clostridia bacterium]|nr:hypothetical protein [Clostridia bacterium]
MATTTITSTLLTGLRNRIVEMAGYGRYRIGNTWYRAELNGAAVQGNGAIHITFYIDRQDGNNPATEFQICASNGSVLVDRVEEISFAQTVDRILIRFKLGVSVGAAIQTV